MPLGRLVDTHFLRVVGMSKIFVNSGQKLQINVIEARDLAVADDNGFSDPFCVVQVGPNKNKTKVKRKTLNPKWGETISLPLASDSLHVTVWDWDVMSSDDFLGEVKIPLRSGLSEGAEWYKLQPRDAKDLTVKGEICMRIRVVDTSKSKKTELAVMEAVKTRIQNLTSDENGQLGLDLCGVNISILPPHLIGEIDRANVAKIDLSFNFFSVMPELAPIKIEYLNLSGNSLTSLPASLGALITLKELVLNGNQLAELPPELGQLRNLEKLELANNQLSKMVPEIGRLSRLEELILTGNTFGTLPPHVGGLLSLEVLDVSSCAITNLPEEFTLMTRLIELNLGNNKLQKLPEGIGRMTRLANLNLMDNQLPDLPLSIGYCCGLGKLGSGIALARNPIQNKDMMSKYTVGTDHLLDFLEKRLALAGNPELPPVSLPEDLLLANEKSTNKPNNNNNNNNNNKPATPAPTTVDIDAQLGTKVVLLKNWGMGTIMTIFPKIQKLKFDILRAMNVNDVVLLAQHAKSIKSIAEKGKDLVEPKASFQAGPPPADKVEALKVAVATTLDDVIYIVDQINILLGSTADPQKVIACVGVVKELKPVVEKL